MKRLIAAALILVSLSSCTIRSTQFEAITRLLSPKVDTMVDYRWKFELLGKTYLLYAVVLESGVLFTNKQGLLVKYDGWTMRLLDGTPVDGGRIEILDYGSTRVVKSRYDSEELQCEAWEVEADENGSITGYEETCVNELGVTKVNRILLTANGSIRSIHQMVTPAGDFGRLTLLTAN